MTALAVTTALDHLVPRGFYRVGDQVFTDKISALIAGDRLGLHPTWEFHDEIFAKFDWMQEPDQTISDLYTARCRQIRDKYDHVVLHYSGGSDSHNILSHFVKNNILVDEVLVSVPQQYYDKHTVADLSRASKNLHNEWHHVIKPDLAWIAVNLPRTKITVYDHTQDMLDFRVDQDWILHAGEHCNPNIVSRINRCMAIDLDLYDSKRVGHVYGIDKPQVFCHEDGWYFSFLDSILSIQSSSKTTFDHHDHVTVENFYWSPDMPALLIKQAHMVRHYFLKHPELAHLATHLRRSREHKALYQDIIREVIYPYWRREIFQVEKSSSIFKKEFDQWFFEFATDEAKNRWLEGYKFLIDNVPRHWFDFDASGAPNNLRGMWSRWYRIA